VLHGDTHEQGAPLEIRGTCDLVRLNMGREEHDLSRLDEPPDESQRIAVVDELVEDVRVEQEALRCSRCAHLISDTTIATNRLARPTANAT